MDVAPGGAAHRTGVDAAVVGCGEATARLRTGMRVMVDGGTGNVDPE